MLAATLPHGDLNLLRYPLYASVKLDGIRAIVIDGVVMSRTMKPIPSVQVQERFGQFEGCDGELIVGSPVDPACYRNTVSACMAEHHHVTNLQFLVFDDARIAARYEVRYGTLPAALRHRHELITKPEELSAYENIAVENRQEGIITRAPDGLYKNGRSTMNEQGMVKIKRFVDDEAVVIDMEELVHNANTRTIGATGYSERTSHKANMLPMGCLGALVVEWNGKTFRIGTGFTAAERVEFWGMDDIVGRVAKFKYLPIGMKDLPRHPVFLGWRKE